MLTPPAEALRTQRQGAPPIRVALPPPRFGLDGLLHAAAALARPGLSCLDLGTRWTVLTWGEGPALRWSHGDPRPWLEPARGLQRSRPSTGLPLPGGVLGWLGYEAGAACERMPAPRGPRVAPDLALWRVEGAIVQDHSRCAWWAHGSPPFVAQARALWARAELQPPPPRPVPLPAPPPPAPTQAARYQQAVGQALEQIRRGRIYQVNLAWELVGPAVADPVGAWLALRAANPARQGALLHLDGVWVLSNSPECYLRLRPAGAGVHAVSVPIKGTAPRGSGPAGRRHLRESEKERAELTMIVDLVRNDLGRVAEVGGVRWGRRRLRACGDLWHAEQAVRARLRPGLDAWDAIAASFPPGSVTGAPKVAAMEVIAALEDGPRGVYTGSILALGDDGRGLLNVAIRTATLAGGLARLHVGAGIVADSEPEAEWAETLAKGRVLASHVLAPGPHP